jgi:hypothetical protein
MYTVVFESVWVKCGVFVLFAFLLLQPVAPAFADEVAPASASSMEESVSSEEVSVVEPQEVSEAGESPAGVEEMQREDAVVEGVSDQVLEETTQEVNQNTGEVETGVDGSIELPVAHATSTEEGTEPEVDEGADTATTTDQGVPLDEESEETDQVETPIDDSVDVVEEEQSTTTPESATSTGETVLVVDHNTTQLQFNPEECASVGNGAFYCSTPKDAQEFEEDGVFAAPDADGDMEIFVRLNGEETQLTSNTIDDNAPFYDALSDRIVWHANYNDRYQIMVYDMRTNEEDRLTNTPYNNMEPVAYGDIILYQSWIDNNWEIMLHDGTELRRLTNNTQHDVSPSIRDGYIVWQSQFADGWQVAVYDRESDHVEYVKTDGGAKVENPRFVLVYDSTNEAGDVQTIGYDFDNKRSYTLNSIPADLPDELPDPDQTGETRALIQSKNSLRENEVREGDPTPTTTPNVTSTTTPQNGISDIDLTSSSTPQMSTSTAVITEIEDIVIPQFVQGSSSQMVTDIEDLVIPPSLGTSTAEIR